MAAPQNTRLDIDLSGIQLDSMDTTQRNQMPEIDLSGISLSVANQQQIDLSGVSLPTQASNQGSFTDIRIPKIKVTGDPKVRSIRNNNPGNLQYVGQKDATLEDKPDWITDPEWKARFAKFPTMELGINALGEQIRLDASRGLTLKEFINKYAPSVENDTTTYMKHLQKFTQVDDVGTPISNLSVPDLIAGIVSMEGGNVEFEYDDPLDVSANMPYDVVVDSDGEALTFGGDTVGQGVEDDRTLIEIAKDAPSAAWAGIKESLNALKTGAKEMALPTISGTFRTLDEVTKTLEQKFGEQLGLERGGAFEDISNFIKAYAETVNTEGYSRDKTINEAIDLLDPYKVIINIGEQLPYMASLAASKYLGGSTLSTAVMAGGFAGEVLEELDNVEARTGITIEDGDKLMRAFTVAGINAASESYGLDSILKAGKVPGWRGKLIAIPIAFFTEGSTEAFQEITTELSKYGYEKIDVQQMKDRAYQAFLTGGAVGGGIATALASIGASAKGEYQEMSVRVDQDADGNFIPVFRVIKADSPFAGKEFDLENAKKIGLKLPNYKIDIIGAETERFFIEKKKMNKGKAYTLANAYKSMIRAFAAGMEMEPDEMIEKTGMQVSFKDSAEMLEQFEGLDDKILEMLNTAKPGQFTDKIIDLGSIPLFSVIGERAQLSPVEIAKLAQAKYLIGKGLDPEKARLMTGWYFEKEGRSLTERDKGPGRWKKRVDPTQLGFNDKIKQFIGTNAKISLKFLMDKDSELFNLYPQLADMQINFGVKTTSYGFYNPSSKDISIGELLRDENPDEGLSTLIHEIQHAIQDIEGYLFDNPYYQYVSNTIEATAILTKENHPLGIIANAISSIIDNPSTKDDVISKLFGDKALVPILEQLNMTEKDLQNYPRDMQFRLNSAIDKLMFQRYARQSVETEATDTQGIFKAIVKYLEVSTGRTTVQGTFTVEDFENFITVFETGNFKTLLHETAHFFRKSLPPAQQDKLKQLLGLDVGEDFDTDAEELFADLFVKYIETGNVDEKILHWIREMRAFTIDTMNAMRGIDFNEPGIDDTTFAPFVPFFNKMLTSQAEDARKNFNVFQKMWYRIWSMLSITEKFKMAGFPELGIAIKDRFSVQNAYEREGAKLLYDLNKAVKGNHKERAVKLRKAMLISESNKQTEELMASDDAEMKAAVKLIRDYFKASELDYIKNGGIRQGYKQRLIEELLQAAREAVEAGDQKKFEKLAARLEELDDLEFVHVPVMRFIKAKAADPDLAIAILDQIYSTKSLSIKGDKRRFTLRLKDLIGQKFEYKGQVVEFTEEDIVAADIIKSYATVKGNDISLLKIRNAGLKEGAVKAKDKSSSSDTGWFPADTKSAMFKGYQVNGTLYSWISEVTSAQRALGAISTMFTTVKMGAFYNPVFLPMYNILQAVLDGSLRVTKPFKTARLLYEGMKSVLTQDEDYFDMLKYGGTSQPYKSPFEDVNFTFNKAEYGRFKAIMRRMSDDYKNFNPFKLGWRGFKEIYQMSWELAWTLENGIRMATYKSHIENGIDPQKSAQLAAKVHGDYADVPASTRQILNIIFFTPTYKIAMGKLLYDSLNAATDVVAGKADISAQRLSAITFRALAISIAFDMAMLGVGWEREEFGLKYKKEGEGQWLNKEMVMVWSAPHNLWQKFLFRAIKANEPDVEDGIKYFVDANQFEFHPIYRIANAIVTGEAGVSERVFDRLDDPWTKFMKRVHFAFSESFQLAKALAGDAELSPEGRLIFEREYGTLIANLQSAFAFVYARNPTDIRNAQRIERFKKLLDEEVGKARIQKMISAGKTEEEILQTMSEFQAEIDEWNGRMQELIDDIVAEQFKINSIDEW